MKQLRVVGVVLWFSSVPIRAGVGMWTTNGPENQNGNVVVDDAVVGTLYTGTTAGLSVSTDNGASWSPTQATPFLALNVLAARGGVVYAQSSEIQNGTTFSDTLWKSSDGGGTWQKLSQHVALYSSIRYGITIDPASPSTVYRSSGGGNFRFGLSGSLDRSTDGGLTWTEIDAGLGGAVITAFAIDPVDSSTLYVANAAMGVLPIPPPTPQFFKSTDSGATWTLLTDSLGSVSGLAIDPMSGAVYAATTTGVHRSGDGGTSFQTVNSSFGGEAFLSNLVLDPAHAGRLYATASGVGVVTSADAGMTWTNLNNGLAGAALDVHSLALGAAGDFLHATTEASGVFDYQVVTNPAELTLDAAHPFTVTLSATDQRTGRAGPGVATQVNDLWGFFSAPAITDDPDNPEVFVKLLDGTAINGSFWFFYGGLTDLEYTLTVTDTTTGAQRTYTKPAGSECGGSDTAAFERPRRGALLALPASTQTGVWTSHLSSNGRGYLSIATDPGIPDVVYTNVARSLDDGRTWESYDLNPPALTVGAGPAGTVYAAPGTGILYKSTDSGRTWSTVPFSSGGGSVTRIAVDPVSPGTVYAAVVRAPEGVGSLFHPYGELWRSDDGGQTWSVLDSGFPGEAGYDPPGDVLGLTQGGIFALALDPVVSGIVYVSAPLGNFKSTDGGTNWTSLPPLPEGPNDRLGAWVVAPSEPARMYGISRAQLIESADGGNHFSPLPGLSSHPFTAIALDPVRPNRIYAAITSYSPLLAGSVVMSDDAGGSWQAISNAFPDPIASLAVDAPGRFLHASTFSGVYDYEIPADPGALSLNAGHFSVRLSATDPRTGRTGPGVATPYNDLWGYFSIPAITSNPNNPEVFVKLLDGTAINGEFWFFYGGLTDLEYTLTVTDVATGAQRSYTKPAGSECGGSDTAAFP